MKKAIVGTLAILLSACGGGGGDNNNSAPPAASAAQGVWGGTTSAKESFALAILDSGAYYAFYGPPNSATGIAGVIIGAGTSQNGSFSSSNAKNFNFSARTVTTASVSATYSAKNTLNGTVVVAAGSETFTSSYGSVNGQTASLATIAGTFTGQDADSAGVENASFTVSASGALVGSGSSGCSSSGTVAPHGTQGGIFDVSLTFPASASCAFPGQTLHGVAIYNQTTNALLAVLPNSGQTDGVLFAGSKN
ncbi:MAG: hypothetical protein ACRYG5_07640 [Janthinobacterium lividum]